ncbi:MAG: tetratricopeptide repeat protein [Chloroflexota bacterium]
MTSVNRHPNRRLIQAREDLEEARASEDQHRISLATANLGLAYFNAKKFKEGEKSFREAEKIVEEVDDFSLRVKFLGIKTLAYQFSGQLPVAFQVAQDIQELAEDQEVIGLQSDALATQAQILIESGDEIGSLDKFNAALKIAEESEDKKRIMRVKGALGHYSLAIGSGQQAETYFEEARDLARDLGDRGSEIGYQGNLGTLFEWKGDYPQAKEIFEDVLAFMRETGNQQAEIQALHHLIQISTKLQNNSQSVEYSRRGIELTKKDDIDTLFFFYENLISALYRSEKIDQAHTATKEALERARSAEDTEKEVSLLLSLGESYMLTDKLELALETYQLALDGTQRLQRLVDRAYLLGRTGVVLAELEKTDEAIVYHQQSLEAARNHELIGLEGEQLTMLAIAYRDKNEMGKAKDYANQALQVFLNSEKELEAEKVRQLLSEFKAAF